MHSPLGSKEMILKKGIALLGNPKARWSGVLFPTAVNQMLLDIHKQVIPYCWFKNHLWCVASKLGDSMECLLPIAIERLYSR